MSEPGDGWTLDLPPLETGTVGRWVLFYETAASTQTLALAARRDGLAVVADTQTEGRGRRGARWDSAPGLGLWCSVCLEGAPAGWQFAAALAVFRSLKPLAPVILKWPNDVLCGGLKLCGVLVEHRDGWNAVGMGLNVHHRAEDFPPPLRGAAGSLAMHRDGDWDRAALLAGYLRALDAEAARLRAGDLAGVRRDWLDACGVLGEAIERDGVSGIVAGAADDGALIVDTAAGRVRLDAGGAVPVAAAASAGGA